MLLLCRAKGEDVEDDEKREAKNSIPQTPCKQTGTHDDDRYLKLESCFRLKAMRGESEFGVKRRCPKERANEVRQISLPEWNGVRKWKKGNLFGCCSEARE